MADHTLLPAMNATTRTIVIGSHSYPAAHDCGNYLKQRIPVLYNLKFEVVSDNRGDHPMCKLVFVTDLDRVKGGIDLEFTNHIVEIARAFIVGRGGLPQSGPRVPRGQ